MKLNDIDIEPYDTLLLDRDGTINVHIVGDYVRKWDDFEFIPGALEALAKFANHFKYIFIVTNQRGIGKGKYTESDLMDIHNKMCAEIRKAGGRIDKIYYCTALTEEDIHRKPGRGMFDDIIRDFPDVNPSKCLMVGDGDVDMEFATNCGIKGIKVDSLKKENGQYKYYAQGSLYKPSICLINKMKNGRSSIK
ncbi:HAD family hydrolase [Candidatus Saccharibacteria bacterium]|nr:HAD family hydrolase [Candidatus Saccharibacteria bacterium]